MARGRMISKSLGSSRRFHSLIAAGGKLGEFCQVLFPLLVANTDDYGRMAGDAFTVKNVVLPSSRRTEREFDRALDVLADVDLIDRYAVDGAVYLQIVRFDEHQINLHKRNSSKIPDNPDPRRKFRSQAPEAPGTLPDPDRKVRPNVIELNVIESKKYSGADGAPRSPADNVSIITKIAHEVIDQIGPAHADVAEAVKDLCAQRKILYDSTVVGKAVDSARVQQSKRRAAG